MPATVAGIHLGPDTHANRPAANAAGQPYGALYSCTTHSKVYVTDGATWSDWADATAGGIAASVLTAKGSLITATAAATASELAAGANGKVPTWDSAQANGMKAAYPPGYEFGYTEKTSNTSPTNTTEGTADTIITAAAIAYDGSTRIKIEFFAPNARADAAAARAMTVVLYDDTGGGAASIGIWTVINSQAASSNNHPLKLERYMTPSAATHTFSVRAYVSAGTGLVAAGAGGSGAALPAFIRQSQA